MSFSSVLRSQQALARQCSVDQRVTFHDSSSGKLATEEAIELAASANWRLVNVMLDFNRNFPTGKGTLFDLGHNKHAGIYHFVAVLQRFI